MIQGIVYFAGLTLGVLTLVVCFVLLARDIKRGEW